jgi:hypothetical protein
VVGRIAIAAAYSLLASLALVLPLGCSGEASQDRINRIIHCKAEDVQQVVLLPVDPRVSLVTKLVPINDRASIDAICQALNGASKFSPNHPSTKWEVKVELRTEKDAVAFVVYHTEQANNGTVVAISSNVTSGWNYGRFRSDALGPILEKLAKAANG